jgi:hypothetical protein
LAFFEKAFAMVCIADSAMRACSAASVAVVRSIKYSAGVAAKISASARWIGIGRIVSVGATSSPAAPL